MRPKWTLTGVEPQRTQNMAYMLVTLDVSRLSGWSNANADCRVERGAQEAMCVQGDGRDMGRKRFAGQAQLALRAGRT